MILLLNLLIIVTFAVTAALTIQNPVWTSWAFIHCSYYIIFALVIAWCLSSWHIWQEKRHELPLIKTYRNGLLFSFILTSLVFISVPHYFRILSDETNTLSVAKSLTFNKSAENVTEGRWYYEMFWPSKSSIDKRPLLFPFCLSVLDTGLGYRPENAFLLNYIALWACLFLLYLLIRSSLSEILTYASIILVMSQPIMALTATSSSIEIFNLLFILSSLLSLKYFINTPNRNHFTALCLNLLMLANVRYESFIFLGVIVACLLVFRYIRFEFFEQSASYALMLFLSLPLIWQRVIYLRIPDVDMPDGLWIKAFGIKNVGVNVTLFFKYLLNINGHLGFAGIVNWLGIAAICYGLIVLLTRKCQISKQNLAWLSCCALSLLAFFIVILFYNQARMTQHPMNGRLYMPLLIALSILPVYALNDWLKNNAHLPKALLAAALSLFVFYHPVAEEGRLENQLYIIRDYRHVMDFLKTHADRQTLIICNRPGQYIIYNYGAVSFSTANLQKNTILQQFNNRLFNKIYVVQEVPYLPQTPGFTDTLDPSYRLQTIDELQGGSAFRLRISEVVNPHD